MDDLFCYSCQRNYPAVSNPPVYNDEQERTCPSCRSEFVELVPAPVPQQPPQAIGSGFPRLQGSLEVHMAASVFPSNVPAQTLVFQLSNGVLTPITGLAQGPGMPISLGDFGFGESLDQIVARIAELHQPPIIPTSQTVLDSLPRQCPKPDDVKEPQGYASCRIGEACTVCHEEYEAETLVVELPCQHCFHEDCILPWLREHNTCPVCRFKLPEGSASAAPDRQHQPRAGLRLNGITPPAAATVSEPPSTATTTTSSTLPDTVQHVNDTQAHINQLEEILAQQLNEHATLQQEMQALQEQRDRLHQQYQQLAQAGQQAAVRLADIMNRRQSGRLADGVPAAETLAEAGPSVPPANNDTLEPTEAVSTSSQGPDEAGGVSFLVNSEDPAVFPAGAQTRASDSPPPAAPLLPTPAPQRQSLLANVVAVPRAVFAIVHGVVVRPMVELANIAGRGMRRLMQF